MPLSDRNYYRERFRGAAKPPKPRRSSLSGHGCSLTVIALIAVIIILVIVVGVLSDNQNSSYTPSPPRSPTPSPKPSPVQTPATPPPAPKSIPQNQINDEFSFGLVIHDGLYISGSHGLVVLINNKNARNPTYQELIYFLTNDNTDSYPYKSSPLLSSIMYGDPHDKVDKKFWLDVINGVTKPNSPYICADFAQMLHNNAEIAGIRAGYVCTEDHAFNVFETTDKGIIYIDDTGESDYPIYPNPYSISGSVTFGDVDSNDKVAYIEIRKPFGLISLSVAHLYGFNYEGYEKWVMKKELFDNKSDEYDSILNGRLFVPEDEYYELNKRLDELKALSNELGGFWETGDIVGDFEVVWDGE